MNLRGIVSARTCTSSTRITYKTKSNPDKKQYLKAKKFEALKEIWEKAKDTKDPIEFFEVCGHGLSASHKTADGLGIIIGKDTFGIGTGDTTQNYYGINDYQDLIKAAFTKNAVIELEVCGNCSSNISIGYAFKNVLPNATVTGYTGFASYWAPGVWETRRHMRDPFCKWVEAK